MRSLSPSAGLALVVVASLLLGATCCRAAATVTEKIDPPQVNAGENTVVTITVQNGTVTDLQLPEADGVTLVGTRSTSNITFSNGTISRGTSFIFVLGTSSAGDFTIPAFDVPTQEGETLHVKAMKLHVNGSDTSSTAVTAPATPVPSVSPGIPVNPHGPVVMPPANAAPPAPQAAPTDASKSNAVVPRDPGGGPAKVFMIITPQTTSAYVGQSVPMEIDFYIRADVNWQQNSLPTIQGSDFLMNSFKTRGHPSDGLLENEQYIRESWLTSIASPKSGDFPLSMERDTYWVKSYSNTTVATFFGNMYGRQPDLAHEMVTSNLITMHVEALPAEGRPDHFTGAIGQFKVSGEAEPDTVDLGEPVTLRFTVSGNGNFDYVRCPALADDAEWKAYAPRSGTNYQEESHTVATKIFEQSVIPKKNGNVPLPAASFSYFDPTTKQYVTVPIPLPDIVVTGTPPPISEAAPSGGDESVSIPVTPKSDAFQPNRLEFGSLQTSLEPAYRNPWFWAVETTMIALPIVAALWLFFIRPRLAVDDDLARRELRQRSVRAKEDAMAEAVRRNDPLAFFTAARHAIQLQLGAHWSERPESLTLAEIRRRDPQQAERLAPFFAQADEVIYSGRASAGLDLAQWETRIRTELLQPQPA